MRTVLTFNDPQDWLEVLIKDVEGSYIIPKVVEKRICLELGVNVGAFAIAHHRKFGKIFGLEASLTNWESARKNIKERGIENVEYFNLAAGKDSNAKARLRSTHRVDDKADQRVQLSGDSTIFNISNEELIQRGANLELSEDYEEVSCINFPDLLKLIDVERVNYLKCDIEGSEYDFFMNHDLSNVDFIAMELHYSYLGKQKVAELMSHLAAQFEFYDNLVLKNFTKDWPPPAIVHLINKRIISPFFVMGRTLSRLKNAVRRLI